MPHTKTKTDNKHLIEKLDIRKRICRELQEPLRVLDLFSGEGKIWRIMGRSFQIASYTPCDKIPKLPGTIRMDVNPRTVQAFDPSFYNCIDIDCYGDPFEIWAALASRIVRPTAVFLTFGHTIGMAGVNSCSKFLRQQNGIPLDWHIPTNRDLVVLLGRRYLAQSMFAARASLVLAVDHAIISYYGALIAGSELHLG